jgi:hypothetical protein
MRELVLFWCNKRNLNAMNFLQENGLISDNAIEINDVDERDWSNVFELIKIGKIESYLR